MPLHTPSDHLGFARFTAPLLAALAANRDRIRALELFARQHTRLREQGGHLFHMLPVHFMVDARDVEQLAAAARALLDVQTAILRHLVATEGRDGVIRRFAVPEAMQRFINWDELVTPQQMIARFDILQAADGYHFCEFNVDSCVAGGELFDYMVAYFDALGVPVRERFAARSPLEDLGGFLAGIARRKQATRVVILDWSVGGGSPGKGYFSFDVMRAYFAQAMPALEVVIADERTYDPAWLAPDEARRTVVHRGFMMEEMDDAGRFLDQLLAAGTTVVNTYDSEIRMNKGWFALFHDPAIAAILTDDQRALVTRYIPYTADLTEANLAGFLADKQRYIFKAKVSFGGIGIRIGDELAADVLEAELRKDGLGNWTVQQLLEAVPMNVPHDAALRDEPSNMVLGLYLYGGQPNGIMVRASTRSRIVNVTAGRAAVAWALPVSEAGAGELIALLAP